MVKSWLSPRRAACRVTRYGSDKPLGRWVLPWLAAVSFTAAGLTTAYAQASQAPQDGAIIFQDLFDRRPGADLGPDWRQSGTWQINGRRVNNRGLTLPGEAGQGYADMATSVSFPQSSYVLETRVLFSERSGGMLSDHLALAFGGDVSGRTGYHVKLYFFGRIALTREYLLPSGQLGSEPLAAADISLAPATFYDLRVVRDGASGLIQVYLDGGADGDVAAVLYATDTAQPSLGELGWVLNSEGSLNFYMDWIEARELAGEPPSTRGVPTLKAMIAKSLPV